MSEKQDNSNSILTMETESISATEHEPIYEIKRAFKPKPKLVTDVVGDTRDNAIDLDSVKKPVPNNGVKLQVSNQVVRNVKKAAETVTKVLETTEPGESDTNHKLTGKKRERERNTTALEILEGKELGLNPEWEQWTSFMYGSIIKNTTFLIPEIVNGYKLRGGQSKANGINFSSVTKASSGLAYLIESMRGKGIISKNRSKELYNTLLILDESYACGGKTALVQAYNYICQIHRSLIDIKNKYYAEQQSKENAKKYKEQKQNGSNEILKKSDNTKHMNAEGSKQTAGTKQKKARLDIVE